MDINVINYKKIQQSINDYGQDILNRLKNRYCASLTQEQLHDIDNLLNIQFIVIEKPPLDDDIVFFSKQAGIDNPDNYNKDYIPSAHGGRTKGDNKIHIYPYTKAFNNCNTDEEIIKSCIDNIVVHEIFHYFIRPNLSNKSETIKDKFGHFITEGLVQYYVENFSKEEELGIPKSNYKKNVSFVKQLISSFPDNLTKTQIDRIIFTYNQDELLEKAQNGKSMYDEYVNDFQFKENLALFIKSMCIEIGMDKKDKRIDNFIGHYRKIDDIDTIFDDLSNKIELIFKNNEEKKNVYISNLRNLVSERKSKKGTAYKVQMNTMEENYEEIK